MLMVEMTKPAQPDQGPVISDTQSQASYKVAELDSSAEGRRNDLRLTKWKVQMPLGTNPNWRMAKRD